MIDLLSWVYYYNKPFFLLIIQGGQHEQQISVDILTNIFSTFKTSLGKFGWNPFSCPCSILILQTFPFPLNFLVLSKSVLLANLQFVWKPYVFMTPEFCFEVFFNPRDICTFDTSTFFDAHLNNTVRKYYFCVCLKNQTFISHHWMNLII